MHSPQSLPSDLFILEDKHASDHSINKGEKSQRELIRAAIILFAEKGIEGTTTREIAKLAKQNISAIAYYFGSKEGLYLSVTKTITRFAQHHFADLNARCQLYLNDEKNYSGEQVKKLFSEIYFTFFQITTLKETVILSKLILNEQLNPSASFSEMHETIFGQQHKILLKLLKTFPNIPFDDQALRLHIHALLGAIAIFRFGQATIQLETGWYEFTEHNLTQIQSVLQHHIELFFQSLETSNSSLSN